MDEDNWDRGSDVADDLFGFFGGLIPNGDDGGGNGGGSTTTTTNTYEAPAPIPWIMLGGIALAAIVALKVL